MEEKVKLDSMTRRIIAAAIEVHRSGGPGLVESAHQSCLAYELRNLGRKIDQQKSLPVACQGLNLDRGYRLEPGRRRRHRSRNQGCRALARFQEAQLLSHLQLWGERVGRLIDFHVRVRKHGL